MHPIYTPNNTKIAFKMNWIMDIFWREEQNTDNIINNTSWLPALRSALSKDGVTIYKHRFRSSKTHLFTIGSNPFTAPETIIQRLKGRLQHILRDSQPKAFSRKYSYRSVGSTKRIVLESYIRKQIAHHNATNRFDCPLEQFQIYLPENDLSQPRSTAHARYWYNLHLVFKVNREYAMNKTGLQKLFDMTHRVCKAKDFLLSRASILPDHVHVIVGCPGDMPPADVGFAFMNNYSFALGMVDYFQYGFFVATFGEYDLGAINLPLEDKLTLHRRKAGGGVGVEGGSFC